MNYEKKYKEALERARDFKNGEIHRACEVGENIMDYIFPELAESEDEDERIRRDLINFFKNESFLFHKREEIIAWLEKQELRKGMSDFNKWESFEIPFGAKDSELHEETIYIPEGFHAEIKGNKVVIKKNE